MTTHIEITTAGVGMVGGAAPIERRLLGSQTITPSASNQVTTFAISPPAEGLQSALFATVTADENVFIAIGKTSPGPDATVATGRRAMVAGGVRSFHIGFDEQVAVVTR